MVSTGSACPLSPACPPLPITVGEAEGEGTIPIHSPSILHPALDENRCEMLGPVEFLQQGEVVKPLTGGVGLIWF